MVFGYEVGFSTAAAAAGAPYFNLWAPSRPLFVREVKFGNSTNSGASNLRLVRTTARGTQSATTTPTSAANALLPGIAAAPSALVDTAWTVNPTAAALDMRASDLAAAVESGEFWNWEQDGELMIPTGGGLELLQGTGAGQVLRVWLRWTE